MRPRQKEKKKCGLPMRGVQPSIISPDGPSRARGVGALGRVAVLYKRSFDLTFDFISALFVLFFQHVGR